MVKLLKIVVAIYAVLTLFVIVKAIQLPVLAQQNATEVPETSEGNLLESLIPAETVPQVTQQSAPAPENRDPTVPETHSEPGETVPQEVPADPSSPSETVTPTLPMISVSLENPETFAESVNVVPLYYQNDYPTTRYGAGTVEKNGCSIVSLAMVATYLTDQPYYPDQLAAWFGGKGNNNMERLEYGAKAMQLPFEENTNWHLSRKALQEGKVVIALMKDKSLFGPSQHFVVLTGITGEGRVWVNDPYQPNYDRWEMREGFAKGFEEWQIDTSYAGGWVFDKKAMPEDPYLYWQDPYDYDNSRYQVRLTEEEIDLIARLVWVEAQGEPVEGQQAVAEVVLNRLVANGFADNVRDVIYGPGQFQSAAFLKDAEPNQTQYDVVMAALYGESILPIEATYFSTYPIDQQLVKRIGNHYFFIPD